MQDDASTSGPVPALGAAATLRIVSYNIFKARFLDRPGPRGASLSDDFARLETLHGADVVALQEAIVGPLAPGGPVRDSALELAASLRLPAGGGGPAGDGHVFFSGVPHGRDRRWGVALLTRGPARFEPLALPRPFWSAWPRRAVFAEIGPWIVVTLHLEVWPIGDRARRLQTRAILDALERIAVDQSRPIVLAGDFNCQDGGPHAEVRRAGFEPALRGHPATFAFAGLHLHLDHIYVRGARVVAAGVEHRAGGSDHWPVWAEIAL